MGSLSSFLLQNAGQPCFPRATPNRNRVALYRRKLKKGTIGRNANFKNSTGSQSPAGASIAEVLAKKDQKPEVEKLNKSKPSELPAEQRRLSRHLRTSASLLRLRTQATKQTTKAVKISASQVGRKC